MPLDAIRYTYIQLEQNTWITDKQVLLLSLTEAVYY